MSYSFQEESFTDEVIEHLKVLTYASWIEANCSPDTEFNPNWVRYIQLSEMGLIRLFTARNKLNVMVGYITFLVSETLHSMGAVQAIHDSFYINEENRKDGTAYKMVLFAESIFKQEHISLMAITVMKHKDFSRTLKSLGFKESEATYIKRVG